MLPQLFNDALMMLALRLIWYSNAPQQSFCWMQRQHLCWRHPVPHNPTKSLVRKALTWLWSYWAGGCKRQHKSQLILLSQRALGAYAAHIRTIQCEHVLQALCACCARLLAQLRARTCVRVSRNENFPHRAQLSLSLREVYVTQTTRSLTNDLALRLAIRQFCYSFR